ncbi:MAG: EamA family transporter [Nanoarchaeota archaeon]|nr:EamA family transporter [Nanoarchaeota archaeon]
MQYTWLFFALLSAVGAALVAIFGKVGLQGVDSHVATTIRALVMFVFLFIVIAFEGKLSASIQSFTNSKLMFYIVLSGIAGALSWLFYFLALQYGTVAQVAGVDRLSVVFAVVLAALFLSEKIDLKTGLGVSLITIGAIIIALKK